MNRVLWIVMLCVLVAAPAVVVAQDEEPAAPAAPEKPARRVDPAAMKLVKRAMGKMYSAKSEGLKSMSCVVSIGHPQLPFALEFDAKYVVDGESTVKMRDLPPEMAPMADQMSGQFGGMVENVFVDGCKGSFSDLDDHHVEMKEGAEDTVVLTAFRGDEVGSRSEIKFGENGLPVMFTNSGAQGEMTFKPRYEEKDGKYVMSGATMSTMAGVNELEISYQKVGKFWLAKQVNIAGLTLTASAVKVTPAGETTPSEEEGE